MFKKAVLLTLSAACLLAALSGCCCTMPVKDRNPEVVRPAPSKEVLRTEPVTEPVTTEATLPPQTTAPVTEPETTTQPEQTQEPEEPDWQSAYLDYLEEQNGEYVAFGLFYVDADDIPELYLSGCCEAAGDILCTFQDGKIVTTHMNRIGGGSYIPRSGLFMNFNGNMGYYSLSVYKITGSGVKTILTGLEAHTYIPVDETTVDEVVEYSIGTQVVTQQEFDAALAEVFDESRAKSFYADTVSYNVILRQIRSM